MTLLTTAGNKTDLPIAVRFKYDGAWRIVDNIDWINPSLLVGFEMRKNGKFSYKIKKFSHDKMTDFTYIHPPLREGPKIGRPSS